MNDHFKDDEFQFGLEVALGCTYRQAADVGEVLATAHRIKDGDGDSWVREWTAAGGAAWAAAGQARAAERRASALAHFRRAATYYEPPDASVGGVTGLVGVGRSRLIGRCNWCRSSPRRPRRPRRRWPSAASPTGCRPIPGSLSTRP